MDLRPGRVRDALPMEATVLVKAPPVEPALVTRVSKLRAEQLPQLARVVSVRLGQAELLLM